MDKSKIMKTLGGMEVYDEAARMQINGIITEGTGVAYTATVRAIDTLTTGVGFVMIPHTDSTTTAPTLDVNGLGAKPIRVRLSSSPKTTTALQDESFIAANRPIKVVYDGNDAVSYWVIEDMVCPNAKGLYGTVPIASGGTNADTAEQARINLGITTTNNTVLSQNADYAEVGEWADGNSSNEDRIGYFVSIDDSTSGTTMVKSMSTSDVRGVTVSAPAFSGNCADSKFGEDGELLKQYDYVAVMGMVSVIDNGKCTVNGRCMAADDGTAEPSPNNMGYQVIERVDDTHVIIAVEPEADMMVRIKSDVTDVQNDVADLQINKSDTDHKHSADDITSGTLPIARGGTGATTAVDALNALGITMGTSAAPSTGTANTIYIQLL